MKSYEAGVAELVARVRSMQGSDWSPTPQRKAAEAIAAQLEQVAELLGEQGSLQTFLEEFHDRPPELWTGSDGLPEPDERLSCSYKATVMHMRVLADSARRYAADLPDPRKKHALPFAALALVHLRYQHGRTLPTLYDDGDGVSELQGVCEAAGIMLARATLRGALREALRGFDPHMVPDYFREFLS